MKHTAKPTPPVIRPYEPDGIDLLSDGMPRTYIRKKSRRISRKFLNWLRSEQFSIVALFVALGMIAFFLITGFNQRAAVPAAPTQAVTVAPTITPTAFPTEPPDITPTTVTIQLAPIVARRTFKITAYCICPKCCGKTDGIGYGGAKVQPGVSVAADLRVLPLGSVVEIEGIGLRIVQDKGSKVIGDHIDLLMTDHGAALDFGVQYREVTIFEREGK